MPVRSLIPVHLSPAVAKKTRAHAKVEKCHANIDLPTLVHKTRTPRTAGLGLPRDDNAVQFGGLSCGHGLARRVSLLRWRCLLSARLALRHSTSRRRKRH